MITSERWYEPNPDLLNFYQGDILKDIPFPALPTFLPAARQEAWGILRPRPNRSRPDNRSAGEILRNLPNDLIGRASKDLVDAWNGADGEYVIAHARKRRVMLLSRSCDLDKDSRKHYLFAPVIAFGELLAAQRTDEKLRDLRANEIFHYFYLPERDANTPESFADFSQMQPLHRTFFDGDILRTQLLCRLSAVGTAALQSALANFHGKQFGFSPDDRCPQAGRYACSSCFHSGQQTPEAQDRQAGAIFGDCGRCGEAAMWVKLPDPREP